jgi:hypothetical protein
MKSITRVILLSFAVASFAFVACNSSQTNQSTEAKADTTAKPLAAGEKIGYVCPMHADQKSDKAAKCPVCGMDMEKTVVKDSIK